MNENRIEKVTGVYVPFWLFQADAEADCTYKCTKVSRHRQGNYEITNTAHFLVRRGGHLGFNQVPVDGSSKIDDTLMESIEPYNSEKADAFNTGYLSGYQAQRYDVDADACQPRANERIRASVHNHLAVVGIYNGDSCGGCFNTITPQRRVEIASNRKLIICEHCGRIIINPDFE